MICQSSFNKSKKNNAGSMRMERSLMTCVTEFLDRLEKVKKNSEKNSDELSKSLRDLTEGNFNNFLLNIIEYKLIEINFNLEYYDIERKVNTMTGKIEKNVNFVVDKSTATCQDEYNNINQANDAITECMMSINAINNYVNSTGKISEALKNKITHGSDDISIQNISIGLVIDFYCLLFIV